MTLAKTTPPIRHSRQRFLVIQLARMGDLVQTKRLLLSLLQNGDGSQETAIHSEIHLCVDKSLLEFAQRLYPFAQVHGVNAHSQSLALGEMLRNNRQVFGQLAELDFTQVYNLNFSGMNFALAALFESELVHGYRSNKGQRERSLWCKLAMRWSECRVSSPLNLVDLWGLMAPSPIDGRLVNPPAGSSGRDGRLVNPPAGRSGRVSEGGQAEKVEQSGQAQRAGRKRLGVVLAGRESRRSLPPEQLATVLKAVFQGQQGQQGPELVLLGGQNEKPLARQLTKYFSASMLERTTDLSGRTSLTDLFEVLDSCCQIITPDTGIMHLAAHLGIPVQAFFLSSAWCWETGPYGQGHLIWQATTPCAPCLESSPCTNITPPPQEFIGQNDSQPSCLSPFSEKSFLAHLAGRHTPDWPEKLCGLVSGFDSVGVCYSPVDGNLPQREERIILRTLLAEHLGIFSPAGEKWLAENPHTIELAGRLFHEADWVLEQF